MFQFPSHVSGRTEYNAREFIGGPERPEYFRRPGAVQFDSMESSGAVFLFARSQRERIFMESQEQLKAEEGPPVEHAGSNGSQPVKARSEVVRSEIVETFKWAVRGGEDPFELSVRPYALSSVYLQAVDQAAYFANIARATLQERENRLLVRKGELETAILFDQIESVQADSAESENAKKLKQVTDLLGATAKELALAPTGWFVRARDFFCVVITKWDVVIDGKAIPLTPEAISALDTPFLLKLQADLDGFLHGEKRQKRG